jgi:hypothetical protein
MNPKALLLQTALSSTKGDAYIYIYIYGDKSKTKQDIILFFVLTIWFPVEGVTVIQSSAAK